MRWPIAAGADRNSELGDGKTLGDGTIGGGTKGLVTVRAGQLGEGTKASRSVPVRVL